MSGNNATTEASRALGLRDPKDAQRWRNRRLFTFPFAVAGMALLWRLGERASPDTVWIIALAVAVCLALVGFTYLDRPHREDMLKLAAAAAQAGLAVSQLRGGMFGGFPGFSFGPSPASPDEAATTIDAGRLT